MPGKARKKLIDPDKVGVYHCYARCVRRAFLCGDDPDTGKNYDHRKKWVRDKIVELRPRPSFLLDDSRPHAARPPATSHDDAILTRRAAIQRRLISRRTRFHGIGAPSVISARSRSRPQRRPLVAKGPQKVHVLLL